VQIRAETNRCHGLGAYFYQLQLETLRAARCARALTPHVIRWILSIPRLSRALCLGNKFIKRLRLLV
jgi:hypothetical protein